MEILVRAADGDETSDLEALAAWLGGERELQGRVRVTRSPAGQHELGGTLEAVVIAVAGSGGVLAVLAQTLPAWLRTRRSDVQITLTTGERSLELNARRVADPERVIQEFFAAARGAGSAGLTDGSGDEPG